MMNLINSLPIKIKRIEITEVIKLIQTNNNNNNFYLIIKHTLKMMKGKEPTLIKIINNLLV